MLAGMDLRHGSTTATIDLDGAKYILQDIPTVLAKSNQALATLNAYRARLDNLSQRLTRAEFNGDVVLYDALAVLQRSELVSRMAVEVERYIVELGTEGRLIEMQLEETMFGVSADRMGLIRDYSIEDSEENLHYVTDQMAGLGRMDRRVRHHLDVGPGDRGRVAVDEDRAVHLCHLVEHARRVVDVELDAARKHEGELLGLTDDDQPTGVGVDDVVDAFAQRGTRCNGVNGTQQPRILTFR